MRPPRASHCFECDACVEVMDHHCPYISTCVGRRNYTAFVSFVICIWVDCFFIFCCTIDDIKRRNLQAKNLAEAKKPLPTNTWLQVPLAVPIMIVTGLAFLGLCLLVGYHLKLSLFNEVTHEQLKEAYTSYEVKPYRAPTIKENLIAHLFMRRPKEGHFQRFDQINFEQEKRKQTFLPDAAVMYLDQEKTLSEKSDKFEIGIIEQGSGRRIGPKNNQ